jgi:integrase
VGSSAKGWVFTASRGKKPIRMDNLSRREIKPDLKKARIEWHGWHAVRRGLATNLSELDVPDPVIQRILRHATSPPPANTTAKFSPNRRAKL